MLEKNITGSHDVNAWVFGLVNHKGSVYFIEPNFDHPNYDDYAENSSHFHLLWPVSENEIEHFIILDKSFHGQSSKEYDYNEYLKLFHSVTINSKNTPIKISAEFIHKENSEIIEFIKFNHGQV
jgi:hypothetical protein